jgi:protein TonB
MFDLITGTTTHAPHHQTVSLLVSIAAHATLVGAVFVGTVMFIAAPLPQMQMITAFVTPPPPPPPAPAPRKETPRAERAVPTGGNAAPVEPPREIVPEPPGEDVGEADVVGVEGGVPGGIAGGVLGGLLPEIPPPPPPPPVRRGPVRIGGQIKEPSLVHRVEPEYPALALARQMEGVVILEAIVDEEGRVDSVRVLRSPGVFDKAALDAVRQWRYSPVMLNGRPEKFILTVVVSFRLE